MEQGKADCYGPHEAPMPVTGPEIRRLLTRLDKIKNLNNETHAGGIADWRSDLANTTKP